DVDLVEHVGAIGRDDRHAERLTEARREHEQPDERPHQSRDEALALMEKAQALAPYDAPEADEIGAKAEGTPRARVDRAHDSSSPGPVSFVKAAPIEAAPAVSITACALAAASTRPLCSTMTLSSGRTSSTRCVVTGRRRGARRRGPAPA